MHEAILNHPKRALAEMLLNAEGNGDRLIVIPEEVETMTKSGIARAQVAKGETEQQVGTVLAVGKGYRTEFGVWLKSRYKVGDRVVMDKYAGVSMRMDKDGKFHPQHVDIREDILPFKVIRQEAILFRLPDGFPI